MDGSMEATGTGAAEGLSSALAAVRRYDTALWRVCGEETGDLLKLALAGLLVGGDLSGEPTDAGLKLVAAAGEGTTFASTMEEANLLEDDAAAMDDEGEPEGCGEETFALGGLTIDAPIARYAFPTDEAGGDETPDAEAAFLGVPPVACTTAGLRGLTESVEGLRLGVPAFAAAAGDLGATAAMAGAGGAGERAGLLLGAARV